MGKFYGFRGEKLTGLTSTPSAFVGEFPKKLVKNYRSSHYRVGQSRFSQK